MRFLLLASLKRRGFLLLTNLKRRCFLPSLRLLGSRLRITHQGFAKLLTNGIANDPCSLEARVA